MNRTLTVSWTQALTEMGVILRLAESEAEAMLEGACEQEPSRCRRCSGERLYRLSGGRLRCAKCRYSFYRFTGRWLGRHRLPAKTWLAAIKAFELGLGPTELAQVCGLSLPTAAELQKTIQMSLASTDPSWVDAVRACDSGSGVPRSFKVMVRGDGFSVQAGAAGEGEAQVDMPAEGGPDSMRAFRAGVRRWKRLPADRFALKLKEWELRSTRTESIFELALASLVRYMPAGVSERKGGVTTTIRHHHHHATPKQVEETGLVIRQVRIKELVAA